MERDMTTGNPMKLILWFTIPILIGNIFQQFYSMVDTIIVGRFVGVQALAAVGSTGSISFLILGFLMGLTAGFGVLTAQRFGAGDMEGVKKSVASAIVLSAVVTIVLTILSIFGMRPLLKLMNTPADIIDDAYRYIIIICGGIVTSVLYNLLSSIIRALGNSKVPLYFLIVSAILNILLDLWFIIYFKMGVAGAAYATIISQGVSGALCLIYIIKKMPLLSVKKEHFYHLQGNMKSQLRIGIPMALQFSITAIGTMILQSVLNVFGSTVVAAYTAACKVEQLVTQPLPALGVTMSTYCAQNRGAGKIGRIKTGVNKSLILTAVFCILAAVMAVAGGKYMIMLFVDGGQTQVIQFAMTYLNTISGFFLVLGILFIFRNVLQGMGYAFMPMMAGVCELIARLVVSYFAAEIMSYQGICFAGPFAWAAAAVPLVITYLLKIKKMH